MGFPQESHVRRRKRLRACWQLEEELVSEKSCHSSSNLLDHLAGWDGSPDNGRSVAGGITPGADCLVTPIHSSLVNLQSQFRTLKMSWGGGSLTPFLLLSSMATSNTSSFPDFCD